MSTPARHVARLLSAAARSFSTNASKKPPVDASRIPARPPHPAAGHAFSKLPPPDPRTPDLPIKRELTPKQAYLMIRNFASVKAEAKRNEDEHRRQNPQAHVLPSFFRVQAMRQRALSVHPLTKLYEAAIPQGHRLNAAYGDTPASLNYMGAAPLDVDGEEAQRVRAMPSKPHQQADAVAQVPQRAILSSVGPQPKPPEGVENGFQNVPADLPGGGAQVMAEGNRFTRAPDGTPHFQLQNPRPLPPKTPSD